MKRFLILLLAVLVMVPLSATVAAQDEADGFMIDPSVVAKWVPVAIKLGEMYHDGELQAMLAQYAPEVMPATTADMPETDSQWINHSSDMVDTVLEKWHNIQHSFENLHLAQLTQTLAAKTQ